MKKKITVAIILVLCQCFLLVGCGNDEIMSKLPKGLYEAVEGVPLMEDLSGDKYEEFSFYIADIESATLYVKGVPQAIEPTDPCLIRLINFIGNSLEEKNYWQTQGVIDSNEIEKWYSRDSLLEVVFKTAESTENTFLDPKIIVSGDSYLQILDYGEGPIAEQVWPYMDLLESRGIIVESPQWIDLLLYAGLTIN